VLLLLLLLLLLLVSLWLCMYVWMYVCCVYVRVCFSALIGLKKHRYFSWTVKEKNYFAHKMAFTPRIFFFIKNTLINFFSFLDTLPRNIFVIYIFFIYWFFDWFFFCFKTSKTMENLAFLDNTKNRVFPSKENFCRCGNCFIDLIVRDI